MITNFEANCAGITITEAQAAVAALKNNVQYKHNYTIYRVFAPGVVAVHQDIPTDRFATSDLNESSSSEGIRANIRRAKLVARELGFKF